MSEDGNPVCTYSGANSVRVCDYKYWIKWARLLSPTHSENAMKASSSSTGLPLKSKFVKTWKTEVWRWSFLCNEKLIVDVLMYLTTLHDGQNKVETFWFWKVLLHDCSMWPNLTVSKMSDFRFFHFGSDAKRFGRLCHMSVKQTCIIGKSHTFLQALPHECETSLYNGEMAEPNTVNVWGMNSCLYTQLR